MSLVSGRWDNWAALLFLASVSCRAQGCKALREVGTLVPIQRMAAGEGSVGLDFDNQASALLVGRPHGPTQVWPIPFEAQVKPIELPGLDRLAVARFLDNDSVLLASERCQLALWDWRNHHALFSGTLLGPAKLAAASGDGHFFACGGRVFDHQANREVGPPLPLAGESVLQFSADGRKLFSSGFNDPWMVVRELPNGALHKWLAPGPVTVGAIDPRGQLVAVVVRGGSIHLWRLPDERAIASWAGDGAAVALRFVQNGEMLAVGDENGISAYDVRFLHRSYRSEPNQGRLLPFALGGDFAAAATQTGAVYVWNIVRQVVVAQAKAFPALVTNISISPGARLVAATNVAGEIVVLRWSDSDSATSR